MEPRPQRPRQHQPPQGAPQNGGQQTQSVGPEPQQHYQPLQGQQGPDPGAFVAPPRADYDYSPLDLQPPGQRRKRQVIAGIIGALAVIAIGALIVAGWMALRDDGEEVPPDDNNRVAELTETVTSEADPEEDNSSAPSGDTNPSTPAANTEADPPTQVPPTPTPSTTVYDENSIRAELPVVESMPGPFEESGDLPQDLATVTEALGGGPEVESLLSTNGWQAAMSRTFNSTDPAASGSTVVVVSVHAFQDEESAQAMLPEFSTILQGYGWEETQMETMGDGSTMLTWTNADSGEQFVTIYLVKDQLVYRINVSGPGEFDSTDNAIYVADQILAQ